MAISPKPPELIQAQVAAHIASTGEVHSSDKSQVLQNIGELAAGPVVDYSFSSMGSFGQTQEHTLSGEAYKQYVGNKGSSHNPDIQFRYKALQAYKEFAPDIASQVPDLREHISSMASKVDFQHLDGALTEHESYIGSGDQGVAFGFNHNGKEYVAKLSREADRSVGAVEGDLLGLIRGKGMPHMQQIAAISYTDGIIITERLPGKDLEKIDPAVLGSTTKEQLRNALITMHEAFERGILFDPKPSNFIYDSENGFGFIDYNSQNNPEVGQLANDDQMAEEFSRILLHQGYQQLQVKEDYFEAANIKAAQLPVLRNYYEACVELMDSQGYDYSTVVPKLSAKIVELQTFVENCGQAGWIESDIERQAQEQRRARQVAAERGAQEAAMRARGENPDYF